ncbi:MAG: hypothetical protein KA536_10260 [Saprospiraceae bacterium]|nr:hypothetical protein [Saprospiraceae bacterium]
MIFPETPDFSYFFTNSHLKKPSNSDEYDIIELVKPEVASDNKNDVIFLGISAYIKKDCKISFKAIQDKISKELLRRGHISNEEIVNAIFAIILYIPKNEKTLINIDKVLSSLTTGSLNQFLIFNIPNNGFDLKLNEFIIGDIDYKKIEYSFERMGSTDYHKKHSNTYRGKFGVSREYFQITLLNPVELHKIINNRDYLDRLFDIYMGAISKEKQKEFYAKFEEEQSVINLLCDYYFDLKNYMLATGSGTFLSVIKNIGSNKKLGWVVPYNMKYVIELGSKMPKDVIEQNLKKYEFTSFGTNEIDFVFKNFLSFCSKAIKYRIEGRISESLLHYVIALDMVFGEKESSTQSVSQRVAFLVHNQLNIEFNSMVKEIKQYYDLRSKYVHQGIEINEAEGNRIREICVELFTVYLNLHKNKFTAKLNYNQWLKKIDLGIAILNANENISDELKFICGII